MFTVSAFLASHGIQHVAISAEVIPDTIDVDGRQRPTRNSRGRLIYPTLEGIQNFWKWFGDSKTVDAKGRPVVFTHGTANVDIDVFEGNRGYAGHFAVKPKISNEWAKYRHRDAVDSGSDVEYGDAATTYPVYLRCLSLFDLSNASDCARVGIKSSGDYADVEDSNSQRIRAAGYDSSLDYEYGIGKPSTGIAVFSPNQIKSATGNNGNFNFKSSSIVASA